MDDQPKPEPPGAPAGSTIWGPLKVESRGEQFEAKFRRVDALSFVGALIFGITTFWQALGLSGFTPHFALGLPFQLVLSAFGCAAAFRLAYVDRRFWHHGVIPGLFTGPLILLLTIAWLSSRGSITKVEFFIVLLVGGAPGFVLWKHWLKQAVADDHAHPPLFSSSAVVLRRCRAFIRT